MRYCPECGERSDTGPLTWRFLREYLTAKLIADDAGDEGNRNHGASSPPGGPRRVTRDAPHGSPAFQPGLDGALLRMIG